MNALISENNIVHELTPRQFALFKMSYLILRHHAIAALEFQKKRKDYVQVWIGNVLNEMKQILKFAGEDRYKVKLSDLSAVKSHVKEMAGWCNVNESESVFMIWKAHMAVVEILELLREEILHDDSVLCDNYRSYKRSLEN